MEKEEFIQKVIEKFKQNITDEVFLMIQNDRELFHQWLRLVEKHKRIDINCSIGKKVKKEFHLENKDARNKKPKSFLIKSFQEFEE